MDDRNTLIRRAVRRGLRQQGQYHWSDDETAAKIRKLARRFLREREG